MYEVYFNKINDLLGDQVPEVKGLLGYCAFKRGNVTMAIVYYQKAIERNPQFFWYYYNLSAIDLTLGKYNEAFNLLQTALSLDMNQSYGMVLNSRKVYSPILVDYLKDPAQDLIKQFQSGRENAVRMALMAKAGMEGSLDPRVDLKTMFPLMVY